MMVCQPLNLILATIGLLKQYTPNFTWLKVLISEHFRAEDIMNIVLKGILAIHPYKAPQRSEISYGIHSIC